MLRVRSYQKEMLDELDIERSLLFQNLKELEFINKYLGGHAITCKGLKELLTDKSKEYSILDIGCGGGDSLKAMALWGVRNGFKLKLTGIDLKQDCIDYAVLNCKNFNEINFKCDDFRNAFSDENHIKIVHASLFCHHFKEEDLIEFIKLCNHHKVIFLINDLERNLLAYYLIKILTQLFSKSILVKNDAPLSVSRGFKRKEWHEILKKSSIEKYEVKNKWAFRHLIISYSNAR